MVVEGMSKYLKIGGYEKSRYSGIAGFFKGMHGKLLDVGCCYGGLREYIDPGIQYFGVDGIDVRFPNYIQHNFNTGTLPFSERSFEMICCCATLEHLLYPREILKELNRILKNDGSIVISLPNDEGLSALVSIFKKVPSFDDSRYGHHWRFSIRTAREFIGKEFDIYAEKAEYGPLYNRYLFWLKFKKWCTEVMFFGKKCK